MTFVTKRIVASVAVATLLVGVPVTAFAFALGGTADLDLNPGGDAGDTTYLTLAGFELEDAGVDWYLVAFAEFGPDTTIAGRFASAGQLWIRIPIAARSGSIDGVWEGDDANLSLVYAEWDRNGASRQSESATGQIDVVATWFDGEPSHADLEVDLVFTLPGGQTRRIDGALFGGYLESPNGTLPAYDPPTRTRYYATGTGCHDETVVYEDPYYDSYDYYEEDDQSCASDDPDADRYDDSDNGCDSDSGSSSDDDSGCEGDDISDDSEEEEEDDTGPDCAADGDGLSKAGWRLPLSARHIHLWGPLAFVVLLRRRPRSR